MIGLGDKLVAAHHFARDQIQRKLDELQEKWDVLRGVVEERVELLDLSVQFHDSQQEVRQSQALKFFSLIRVGIGGLLGTSIWLQISVRRFFVSVCVCVCVCVCGVV